MSNRYRDASLSPEERTEDLLAQMTLDEKLAQLQCHFYAHGDLQKDTRYGIGQISTLEFRQALSLEEAAGIQREIQETVMKNSRFGIPAVFHMEGLCGALVQDATSFPAGIGRGASFDPALEEKISEIVSRQERALGITQILAPVLDINREPRMGREGETYGEDSTLAAAMGSAYTRGVHSAFPSFVWIRRLSPTCRSIFNTGFKEVIGSWKIIDIALPRSFCISVIGVLTML